MDVDELAKINHQTALLREISAEMRKWNNRNTIAPPQLLARAGRLYREMDRDDLAADLRATLHARREQERAVSAPWAEATLALLAGDDPFWD